MSTTSQSVFCSLVYAQVQTIPKGSVATYRDIATRIGNPNAARAVGSCLKKNFDPSVPCHRVILSSGELGAYNRGGTKAKHLLLKREGWCG